MKVLIFTILLFSVTQVYGQVDSVTHQFLSEVLKRETDSSILIYTETVHPEMFNYKKLPNRKVVNKQGGESLKLTRKEYRLVKDQWGFIKNYRWPEKLFPNSLRISIDSLPEFLRSDRARVVYLVSKPIFLRNNTIALVQFSRLCCGGIFGPDYLLYYKKANGKWDEWIFVREAYF